MTNYAKNYASTICQSLQFCREGRGGGAERARADFNNDNFVDIIEVISTKCGDFYQTLLETKILEKFCVKGITCCHGKPIFDAIFTQILTILISFSIN